ncbi:MAG TPA: sugar phosphate isomerase/epimerase, partial [Segetibacter sp.]
MINRRELLKVLGVTAGISFLPRTGEAEAKETSATAFSFCLNMATIRGHNLGFVKELEVAANAGFRSVEIWMDSLKTYLDRGGSTREAKKRLDVLGIRVENAIGFAQWIVEDDSKRKEGLI